MVVKNNALHKNILLTRKITNWSALGLEYDRKRWCRLVINDTIKYLIETDDKDITKRGKK